MPSCTDVLIEAGEALFVAMSYASAARVIFSMHKFVRQLLPALAFLAMAAVPGRAVPISFVYADGANEGFNDPAKGADRKATFEAAANYYAQNLAGTVPLVISAKFNPEGGTATAATLAHAGPASYQADWSSPAAPRANTWYPIGLANQLAGRDLDSDINDINVTFNTDVDGNVVLGSRVFYYGTDGNAGSNIDFYSVVLHELGHGLGFLTTQNANGSYYGDKPSVYDRHLKRGSLALPLGTDSQRKAAATSGELVFNGPLTNAANFGSAAKLYSPSPLDEGSSISHLDEASFSGVNELMTPLVSSVTHYMGPVATGVFRDLGWNQAVPGEPTQTGNVLVVNTTDDHDDGSCTTADCSLSDAIKVANAAPGTQTISFNLGTGEDQLITLVRELPAIVGPLNIKGPTSFRLTISGNNLYRIFHNPSTSLSISNLTLQNGKGLQGGAVYTLGGTAAASLSMTNCTITGNSANNYGGGVYAIAYGASVSVNLTRCTFNDNTSNWGAGFYLWKYSGGTASASVSNCTFSGNAAAGYGGAIANYGGGTLALDSVTIADNTANLGAAVLSYTGNSTFTSRNSLYSRNISKGSASCIYADGTLTSLGHNIFTDAPAGFNATGDRKGNTVAGTTLGPLDLANGGRTATRALLTGNPAINNGSSDLTIDQRGALRPQDGGVDVGAYEVGNLNTDPSISIINNVTTPEDTPTGDLPFTVGDAETPVGSLIVTGASSDQALIPDANIVLGGSGASRTVKLIPAANRFGTAIISLTVDDGTLSTTMDFNLTVAPVNDAPTISEIEDQVTNEDVATPPIAFTVGDIDNSFDELTVTGTSDNQALVPDANIVAAGTEADRTVVITPAANQWGTAVITLTVSDGDKTATEQFTLTVININDAPTISAIDNQATDEDTPTAAIPFTVADGDGPLAAITLSGTSSNQALVPDGNITFGAGATDADRTVTVTPAANASGTAIITVTASDGTDTGTATFTLTVNAVNDAPTISDITGQSTPLSTATGNIPFTIGDADSPLTSLTVSGSSDNQAVVPNNNVVVSGTGANRTVKVTPVNGQSGVVTITLTVSDGLSSSSDSFLLTVIPAPTIISFTPTFGFAGDTVVITGTDFLGATIVRFNGISAIFEVDSATQITATVPPAATTGPITVYTPSGIGTSTTPFIVDKVKPSVTVTSPANKEWLN